MPAPTNVAAPCRLALVFASEAPVVAVLRRGPSEWVELVKWRTDTDSFEDGQWLRGRVYGERCGLSPDGTLLVYFAAKRTGVDVSGGYKQTFTAVSKLPYWTALAMWPEGTTWGGGGRFIDNKTLRLAYGVGGTRAPDQTTELYMAPVPPHHPRHPPRGLTIETDLDDYAPDRGFRDPEKSGDLDWSGKDHRGRAIITRAGALYYVNEDGREVMLRDFNPDTPRRMVAPAWAQAW